MASGLLSSFVAAIQASLSVLLVISYGGIAAHLGLLDSKNGKAISKICVKMFLPALLLVQLGSEMHAGSAHRHLIVVLWALVAHALSFVIGLSAHVLFKMPDWITCAIMFNNTTSYPLLLIQSLDETGILGVLLGEGDTTRGMIERAKSYFLVFSTISSCLTFAVGPRLIDTEHAPDSDEEDRMESNGETLVDPDEEDTENGQGEAEPSERTGLLGVSSNRRKLYRTREASVASITFFPSQPKFTTVKRKPIYIPHPRWSGLRPRMRWWLLFFYDFLNAPLIGAVLGAMIGLVTPLHKAFFSDTFQGGIFTAWLTESFKSLGQLFVPLPLVVAGISLYSSFQDSKSSSGRDQVAQVPWLTTAFILMVRFVLWPILSIGAIYGIVKSEGRDGILGEDPMLWFAMMLMPTGPPAMKLITMVQVSGAGVKDEQRMAKILTISYIVSPILALTVVGALQASKAAM